MKSFIIAAALAIVSFGCEAQQSQASTEAMRQPKNVLVVYLSRTNNTKVVAEMIQRKVGGSLVALELKTPYPENYGAIVQQVVRENESGFLPPLKTRIDDIARYDVVFLGFPTWGMQLPPPIKSFLHDFDLKGKTVIPFNTNAGYGIGSSFDTVRELCKQCTILQGFTTRGGIERDGVLLDVKGARASAVEKEIDVWLQRINVKSSTARL